MLLLDAHQLRLEEPSKIVLDKGELCSQKGWEPKLKELAIENSKTTVCDKSELFLWKRLTRELSWGFTIVYYSVIYCKNAESVNKQGEIAKG